MRTTFFAWALAASCSVVDALRGQGVLKVPKPNVDSDKNIKVAEFQQLLDHSNPSLGTFSQRYWYDTQYWKGPGSPVVIFTPGEEDAEPYIGYCTNVTINGQVAEKIGAATIVIEHRYWGKSSPYTELTTANMQYLTLENNIADLVNFAKTVQLPFASSAHPSNAQNVPWVLIGGSYSGALTAWVESVSPGTFWAYLATSAPVQAISNYWQYFVPVQNGMPQNCSADVTRVIDYLDGLMENGTTKEISAVKAKFGLESVEHNDDFMAALENGPWEWQELEFFSAGGFFQFCDYVEGAQNTTDPSELPGADGVGLQKALEGYALWQRTVQLPHACSDTGYFTGKDNTECYDTYNASSPLYTDVSLTNTYDRQWNWMLCNQPLGYWQDGAPSSDPTIVSRLVNVEYWVRQCALWFPTGPQGQTYGLAEGKTEAEVNAYTHGWDITNTTRLIYTNGQFDPWREATVSSTVRPGGPLASTADVPVHLIPDGVHCYDLLWENGNVNPPLRAIQNAEIAQIAQWVAEYPKGGLSGTSPPSPYTTTYAPSPYPTAYSPSPYPTTW